MMCVLTVYLFLFFFKQKTAYEMRISDWSSDVCSSDLGCGGGCRCGGAGRERGIDRRRVPRRRQRREPDAEQHEQAREDRRRPAEEIRRAARRHQARRAPAHAEATALRTLHEDDGHQGGADDSLQDKEESEHTKPE